MSTVWARYVERVAGTDNQSEIARHTGIGQPNIHRWLKGDGRVSMDKAARFALAYGHNPLEAFVAAGLLDEAHAGLRYGQAERDFVAEIIASGDDGGPLALVDD